MTGANLIPGGDQRKVWWAWLQKIAEDGVNLDEWETAFVASIAEQLSEGRSLSEKQAAVLERIYSEKTP